MPIPTKLRMLSFALALISLLAIPVRIAADSDGCVGCSKSGRGPGFLCVGFR